MTWCRQAYINERLQALCERRQHVCKVESAKASAAPSCDTKNVQMQPGAALVLLEVVDEALLVIGLDFILFACREFAECPVLIHLHKAKVSRSDTQEQRRASAY